jgi:peptidoglycan/xylan/chitin deacetylase (PgdA/CDA1 family)
MRGATLRILMYHRVIEPSDVGTADPALISATPAGFARQILHLAAHYRVVSATEVLAALRSERALPPRAVLITFDDAYRDFGEIAWPILRRYGLPAVVFVPTAFPDRPEREFWWDRLHRALGRARLSGLSLEPLGALPLGTRAERHHGLRAVKSLVKSLPHDEAVRTVEQVCVALGDQSREPAPVLGWDQLRALADDGVTLGAHTRHHAALTPLSSEEMREEVRGAVADLQREIGSAPPIFAYPYGAFDDRAVEVLCDEGFELALTCARGHNSLAAPDPLRLRRTNITLRTSPRIFGLRLSTPVARIEQWRDRVRPT